MNRRRFLLGFSAGFITVMAPAMIAPSKYHFTCQRVNFNSEEPPWFNVNCVTDPSVNGIYIVSSSGLLIKQDELSKSVIWTAN